MLSLLVSSLAVQISALPTQDEIVGGIVVTPKFKYPWLVSLQSENLHFCGGTLLNPTTVVTAAHCSDIREEEAFVVAHRNRLSSSLVSENSVKFKVTKITIHPDYTDTTISHDIAIWKVKRVYGNSSNIPDTPIEFDGGDYSAENTTLAIAGWGTLSAGGASPGYMRETRVDIVSTKRCQSQYPKLHSSSICAARPGKDTCQGDSGGPLFAIGKTGRVILVGITSYGNGCADPDYAGVYTRVSQFSRWIKSFL